jgi:hypothetical protein
MAGDYTRSSTGTGASTAEEKSGTVIRSRGMRACLHPNPLVCTLLVAAVAACSGARTSGRSEPPPVVANPDGTIPFVPSLVAATRNPSVCNVQNPPFMAGDQFFLDISGKAAKVPSNRLVVDLPSPLDVLADAGSPFAVGAPIMLAVLPYAPQGTKLVAPDGGFAWYADQGANTGLVSFSYTQGADPSEIDTGAFDAVTLTVLAVPRMDGDPLTIRVQVHFVDRKVLDETFSGAVTTVPSWCGAG